LREEKDGQNDRRAEDQQCNADSASPLTAFLSPDHLKNTYSQKDKGESDQPRAHSLKEDTQSQRTHRSRDPERKAARQRPKRTRHGSNGSEPLANSHLGSPRKRPSTIATTAVQLYRRTFHGAVRAENTTISGFGSQHNVALNTLMEEATGVGRHFFQCRVTTLRARQR
jgi:hypothetical protein